MKIISLVLLMTFLAGCHPVPTPSGSVVEVINSSGVPVAGAEVFLNGQPQGSTNTAGRFVFSSWLPTGVKLFARHRVYEHPSYRPGTAGGWVMRVYQTSRIVYDTGSVIDLTVTDPTVTQTLTVRPDNALIGWHLIASLDWDASADEFNQLETRFNDASQYLYNLTDGQFFIEQVEIADDWQLYFSAEIAFKVDSFVWPHTTYPGGFLAAVGGLPHIYMAPFGDQSLSHTKDPKTLVHELGHLALGLMDEYVGPFDQGCTAARRNSPPGTHTDFKDYGDRAACFMDYQTKSNKICSAHTDSFHRTGTLQPGPCWNTVIGAYSDPGRTDRWIVRTPDSRHGVGGVGAVVGKLDNLPVGLLPKITPTNKPNPNLLCEPIMFTDTNGASAAGGTVWVVRPRAMFGSSHDFIAGRLDATGSLLVRGVHLGDEIWSPWNKLIVNNTRCVATK